MHCLLHLSSDTLQYCITCRTPPRSNTEWPPPTPRGAVYTIENPLVNLVHQRKASGFPKNCPCPPNKNGETFACTPPPHLTPRTTTPSTPHIGREKHRDNKYWTVDTNHPGGVFSRCIRHGAGFIIRRLEIQADRHKIYKTPGLDEPSTHTESVQH